MSNGGAVELSYHYVYFYCLLQSTTYPSRGNHCKAGTFPVDWLYMIWSDSWIGFGFQQCLFLLQDVCRGLGSVLCVHVVILP
jgi:hypothetical protein